MHHTCNSCTHTLSRVKKKGPHVHCESDYIPGGLAVTYPPMFFQREENFIPTPVLSCGLNIERTKHYLTHLNSVDISSCGLNFEVLTEKESFSTKCAIPLGYFASCLEPEFTKTTNKKERKIHFIYSSQILKTSGYYQVHFTAATHLQLCRIDQTCSGRPL